MGKAGKVAVIVALLGALTVVIVSKNSRSAAPAAPQSGSAPAVPSASLSSTASALAAPLPRLVDLGSTTCIPCQMMAPILAELEKQESGRFTVEVIDVWRDPAAASRYGMKIMPTQIFFDAAGKELYRHEGFISKQDILAKWKELGFDFEKGASGAETR